MSFVNPVDTHKPMVVVAIPVHNEEDHIAACLHSFARQDFHGAFEVVAFLNNCGDRTVDISKEMASGLPYRLRVIERSLGRSDANAGMARHLAMREAADLVNSDGILLTTDADSEVPSNWISANFAILASQADAVAGMAEMNGVDAARLPKHLIEDEEKAQELGTLLDEIDWLIDPDPADPWPRHTQHSGANIAVRAIWHARVGGIPAIPLGEDRAFFAALRQADARIKHSREAIVTVSGRTVGRAAGGMADTIARRMQAADEWLDDCFEPATRRVRRAILRTIARRVWAKGEDGGTLHYLSRELQVPVSLIRKALRAETFGLGWDELVGISPVLEYKRIALNALEREKEDAREILASLRQGVSIRKSVRPSYNESFASA